MNVLAPLAGLALLITAAACTWQGLAGQNPPPQKLYLVGELTHVAPAEVIAAATEHLGLGFFAHDIAGLRAAVAALPWIAEVSVHRRWPDGVVVRAREHVAVARWGKNALLSVDASLFAPDARPQGLPLLSGPQGSSEQVLAQYRALQARLQGTGLDIAQLRLNPRGAWTATLADGLELRLGREHSGERLARFAAQAGALDAQLRTAAYVDLRYLDGFAIGGKREKPATVRTHRPDQGNGQAA